MTDADAVKILGKDLAVVAENPGECLESKESNVGAFTLSD
jgi:hypothetical protein